MQPRAECEDMQHTSRAAGPGLESMANSHEAGSGDYSECSPLSFVARFSQMTARLCRASSCSFGPHVKRGGATEPHTVPGAFGTPAPRHRNFDP